MDHGLRRNDIDSITAQDPHLISVILVDIEIIGVREVIDRLDFVVLRKIGDRVTGDDPIDVSLIVFLDTEDRI